MSRAGRAGMVGLVAGALLFLSPAAPVGAVSRPTQVATTVPGSAPVASAPDPSSTTASVPAEVETDADGSTAVGDPAADRRIRRIVIGLCALAGAVLVVTLLFWRATRPVPRSLRGLHALGTRSGRRQAAAAAATSSADGPEPVAPPVAPALVPATGTASLPDDG